MIITTKLFNKASHEALKLGVQYSGKGLQSYYHDILRYLLEKEPEIITLSPSSYLDNLDEKDLEELSNYILTDIKEKYGLSEGIFEIDEIKFEQGGKIQDPFPKAFFGDDLMLFFVKNDRFSNNVVTLRSIIYTSDSINTAHKILGDIQEKVTELLEKKEIEPGKIRIRVYLAGVNVETGEYTDNKDKKKEIEEITLDEFNDDIPNDKIQERIRNKNKKDKSNILIFYGDPGCGKSSYINYLISTNKDKKFVYFGLDLILNKEKFRNYIYCKGNENLILIVEDCETILQSRNMYGGNSNSAISDILNMSGGLLGDSDDVKFIFTFNSNLKSIDDAILRSGRLNTIYKFEPLRGEKLKSLSEKLGLSLTSKELESGMTLGDLYNYNNKGVKKEEKQIGFRS